VICLFELDLLFAKCVAFFLEMNELVVTNAVRLVRQDEMNCLAFDRAADLDLHVHLADAPVVLRYALDHLVFFLQHHAEVECLGEDLEEAEEVFVKLGVGGLADCLVDVAVRLRDAALARDALHSLADPVLVHLAWVDIPECFLNCFGVLPFLALEVQLFGG